MNLIVLYNDIYIFILCLFKGSIFVVEIFFFFWLLNFVVLLGIIW